VILCIMVSGYVLGVPSTYPGFLLIVGGALLGLVALYAISSVLTWKLSASLASREGWFWRWYGLVGLWVLLVIIAQTSSLLARSYFRAFYLPSESMVPTLEVNDRIWAQMRDYKIVKRGDVVIVRSGGVNYAKRVAAVPGDTISLQNGIVIIDGNPVRQQASGGTHRPGHSGSEAGNTFVERFPGEERPHLIYDLGATSLDDFPILRLGQDQYFLLGDNRDRSADSRVGVEESGLGVVKRAQIEGRILFRYWREGAGLGYAQP
jgi:signal peptidase I